MAYKVQNSLYALYLISSVILNLFLFVNLLYVGGWGGGKTLKLQLSWSQGAAQEAEAVAAVSCSGHGRAFLDGLLVRGKPVCECSTCFGGPDCSQFLHDCPANADGGDPLFLEPFWIQHAASSALLVAGWHRMSYSFGDNTYTVISKQLDKYIRKVHSVAKNAVTDGRYIVFGVGSTQLLSAAVFALSPDNSSSPARVVAAIPFYPLYEIQTDYFRSVDFKFEGDAKLWKNISDTNTNVIEFVTSPNNPDGQLNKAVLQGPFAKTIHDHAYYWPHFTAIPAPADEDLMIFTISKLTGHAGSRFGWAVVKDEAVYQRMVQYIALTEFGVSRDTQLRALKLLQVVLVEGDGKEIFDFAYTTMQSRWERLSRLISMSRRFSLQDTAPQFCTFFQKVREPSPAYAWLKCEREEDDDCYAVLQAAKIMSREGKKFGAENRHVRLSLIRSEDDFDLLLNRLSKLVSSEDGAQIM